MSINKLLVIVDMQNDFIDGVLGSPQAQAIIPKVIEKIKQVDENTLIICTRDFHNKNYINTEEGKWLPIPHCIFDTDGFEINNDIKKCLKDKHYVLFDKFSFGMVWTNFDSNIKEIEIIGLDTDFCVLANAFGLKSTFYNVPITVDAACCAGSTPEWHEKALDMMEHCHTNIINRNKGD